MKQIFSSAVVITLVISFFSCQKTVDPQPQPRQIDSIKIFGVDSSELVKSFTGIFTDSLGNIQDSGTSYIYYDTINKKIFFTPAPVTTPNPSGYSYAFSYNSSYQLSNLKIDPASRDTGDAVSIDFKYDNQHIISSETQTHKDNVQEVRTFQKTNLPGGGYSLSSEDLDEVFDTTVTVFTFNSSGRLGSWSETTLPAASPDLFDSLVYDAAGNISTVIENNMNNPSQVNAFEMTSRSANGNELSVLNSILYNGISQLPDVTDDNFEGGSQLNGYDNFSFYQFTAYPAATIKVYPQFGSSYVTFNTNTELDSKNRLTSYRIYNGDGSFYYEIIKLGYYK